MTSIVIKIPKGDRKLMILDFPFTWHDICDLGLGLEQDNDLWWMRFMSCGWWVIPQLFSKLLFELILALVTRLHIICVCVCAMTWFGSIEFLENLVLRTNVSSLFIWSTDGFDELGWWPELLRKLLILHPFFSLLDWLRFAPSDLYVFGFEIFELPETN